MNQPQEQVGEEVIWTDQDETKSIIWEAYMGYIEFYNKYVMYRSINPNINHTIVNAGLNRYANYFFEEVDCFLDDFKNKLKKDDIDKARRTMLKSKLIHEDFVFLRRFFATFMRKSGIKNIIMRKDNSSGLDKTRRKYKL